MLRPFLLFLTMLLGIASNSGLAFAKPEKCDLSLSVSNISLAWNSPMPTQQISFTVSNSKKKECHFFITFSKGNAGSYSRRASSGSSTISYQLYRDAALTQVLKELPDVNSQTEILSGEFEKKDDTKTFNYFLNFPSDGSSTLKAFGTYTDTFVLRAYAGELSEYEFETSANIQLTINSPKVTELSLVPTGSPFNRFSTSQTLSFGFLATGATKDLDMKILSNAAYSVTFSSQNNGVLKHTSPSVTTTVPYTLKVNSSIKNLEASQSTPVVVASGSGVTTTDGALHPISITIGSVEEKMAGNYSDNITVTVTATD